MGATIDTTGSDRRFAAIRDYRLIEAIDDREQDDLARLAAEICQTPVALVTVLASDQQWFVARVGTDLCGTPLNDAICTHALDADELLVIPDLSIDPRTRDSAIVAGPPHVRFYAGVPLRIGNGVAVGTLCVIDVVARPQGLSATQRDMLLRLARQAVTTMELRRLLAERDGTLQRIAEAEAALTGNEQRWQRLFENITDGFALGEAIRDTDGRVVDWQFVDANHAWFALSGVTRDRMLALTGRQLDQAAPASWADDLHRMLADGSPTGFIHHVPNIGRWFRGHCFRIDGDRFGAILRDITLEHATEQRQSALIQLGDALRDCHDVADVARVASALVGQTLNVACAGFGRIDTGLTRIEIGLDWTATGGASLAGRQAIDMFGDVAGEIAAGDAIAVDDVHMDQRTAGCADALLAHGIGAFVIVPVRRDGRIVSAFIVHTGTPRRWSAEEIVFLRKVADRVEVGTAQVESEARQNLLIQELAHRLKNTLSMVQAIASQTLRGSIDRAPLDAFERRLQALGVAHDVLVERNWVGADMRATIGQVMAVFGCSDRITLTGPEVALGARAALAMALILHELGTNAVKYGALSTIAGEVRLDWQVEDGLLALCWQEHGGPLVREPARRGFGSKLLRLGLAGTGDSDICYDPAGVRVTMRASLSELTGG
ncbi:GAF domain-containing protein [Sphingomonas panni]|uniref:GAF domain-containing protein n=1 Tax=Sphingomonas panni TaxID=237612 RepID=UPI001F5B784A|nr:GAF domain-containing protein [Sphingomonas panni]